MLEGWRVSTSPLRAGLVPRGCPSPSEARAVEESGSGLLSMIITRFFDTPYSSNECGFSNWTKPYTRSASVDMFRVTWHDHDGGEQTTLTQHRMSIKCIHLCCANSTETKNFDYFVWKDASERVVRRRDDTVDKKRANSCVLKHLFWR